MADQMIQFPPSPHWVKFANKKLESIELYKTSSHYGIKLSKEGKDTLVFFDQQTAILLHEKLGELLKYQETNIF
jgi:hypothetical protein